MSGWSLVVRDEHNFCNSRRCVGPTFGKHSQQIVCPERPNPLCRQRWRPTSPRSLRMTWRACTRAAPPSRLAPGCST